MDETRGPADVTGWTSSRLVRSVDGCRAAVDVEVGDGDGAAGASVGRAAPEAREVVVGRVVAAGRVVMLEGRWRPRPVMREAAVPAT
ncbi:hypothetical protein BJF88_14805 [Cellulosimicrobium sp. CUA-896]|nr:hypothetical protein BJF88_14805 [Cellulosimicrobium sp. CUA-896]